MDIDDLFTETEETEETETPEDMDDLFTEEEPPAEEEPEAETVDIAAITTRPTKVTGRVTAGVGAGAGLIEWPDTPAADGRTFEDLIRYSGFYDTVATAWVDSRPAPYLRFHAGVETALNSTSMVFRNPYMKEVFLDYTFADTVFTRVGKQSLTWGQGRLLANPANLVSRVAGGVAVRAAFPAGPGTLNGVVYILGSWVGNPYSNINPKSYAYAAQAEGSIGPVAITLSGHYKELDPTYEDIGGALSASFALGPVDVAVDGVGHWSRENPAWEPVTWGALTRLYWENESAAWSAVAEYQFDSTVEAYSGHYAALALKTPKIFGGWQPAFRWRHAFQDDSGEVVLGLEGTVSPKLKMTLGVPLVYGAPGTFYREALTAGAAEDYDPDDDEYLIPIDNVVSLLLTLRLTMSF